MLPTLTAKQAKVLELCETMVPKDVAVAMGVSVSRVHNIREELKRKGYRPRVYQVHTGNSPRKECKSRIVTDAELNAKSGLSDERCRCGLRMPCNDCTNLIALAWNFKHRPQPASEALDIKGLAMLRRIAKVPEQEPSRNYWKRKRFANRPVRSE